MTTTIVIKFDASALPKWAQKNQDVVELCKRDLAYRCNVYNAKTAQMKRLLTKQAEIRK